MLMVEANMASAAIPCSSSLCPATVMLPLPAAAEAAALLLAPAAPMLCAASSTQAMACSRLMLKCCTMFLHVSSRLRSVSARLVF